MRIRIHWRFVFLFLLTLLAVPSFALNDSKQPSKPNDSLMKEMNDLCTPAESAAPKQVEEKPKPVEQKPKPLSPLEYAASLLDQNRTIDALNEYKKILKTDKRNVQALIGTACCYVRMDEPRLALNQCKAACDADPSNADAVVIYVSTAVKYGKVQEAIPYLRALMKLDSAKAAKCCWTIAEWIAEKDQFAAQPFARDAHALDPKAYPKPEVSSKKIVVASSTGPRGIIVGPWMSRFGYGGTNPPLMGAPRPQAGRPSGSAFGSTRPYNQDEPETQWDPRTNTLTKTKTTYTPIPAGGLVGDDD